ncbi:hypothetical protein [Flavobacterium lacisediminis]|uniref:Uncharacterized protein n=1 Tax=Flavobacterium lacisediminis TaxID=2989705 RepID=A0ABT3EFF2_9FLAO|nr:hypothetical protein [Flavobacterium lacisediminis]MCW1147311.1 hypothetical protein [Flavobacterium lacisediminis]
MLTFFMWAIGVSFTASNEVAPKSQFEFQQKYTTSDFSHFQTVEVEEGEFIIIESQPEFEVELDWFSNSTKSFNFLQSSLKENTNSCVTSLSSSKETIPLYDLYCNWKFHLS